jgi:catechol 2,3-dioxygenase-like lactoylglutathione lyase family enzyme/ketosteroid isomerase-like protein
LNIVSSEKNALAGLRAEHVMIGTNDYDGTLSWYQDHLGFRIKHEWTVPEFADLKLAYLEKNDFVIEVVASPNTSEAEYPDGFADRLQQPGFGHLAFLVNDVDKLSAELEAKGVTFVVPPTSFPASGRRLSFVEDNNGNMIEFLQELPLGERAAYTGGETSPAEKEITDLTQQWLNAWDIGTGEFEPEIFRTIFAPGENGIEVFDNVQGDVVVIRSVDEYIKTWTPFMVDLPVWSVKLEDLKIQTSSDMAVSTFKLVGTETKLPDGNEVDFGQYGTHVWKKLPDLGWRIVHEHLTLYDASKEKLAP